jgi:hypothetical protein
MDPTAELTRALAEWHRLTELEGEAIRSDNWIEVAEQQGRKERLQGEILLAIVRATPSSEAHNSREVERRLDSAVGELMKLERCNRDLLAVKRSRHQSESKGLLQTLHDLQGVRRAYGSSRGPHWQSYS